jgi:hypothetical protein
MKTLIATSAIARIAARRRRIRIMLDGYCKFEAS